MWSKKLQASFEAAAREILSQLPARVPNVAEVVAVIKTHYKAAVYDKEYFRKRLEDRKARGLCRKCPAPRLPDHNFCASCKESESVYRRKRNKARKDAGLCISCPAPVAVNGKSKCPACQAKDTAKKKLNYRTRYNKGLCQACPKPRKPGMLFCGDCQSKRRTREKSYRKRSRKAPYRPICSS